MINAQIAERLIPKPNSKKVLSKPNGDTGDIMHQVLSVYSRSGDQLQKLAPYLRSGNVEQTCRNIWEFVKQNIAYQVDPPGVQWVKTPARTWADKVCDCKSYSIFIAACLKALGIKGAFRFVSFVENDPTPTHVYVVVKNNGREIIIDDVLPSFNEEKPYQHKQDYTMSDVYTLSGIGEVNHFKIPVQTTISGEPGISHEAIEAAILRERLRLEKEIMQRNHKHVSGIGAVLDAHDYYINQVDEYIGKISLKKIVNSVKTAAKTVATKAVNTVKKVATTAAKVVTAPVRLAAKGVIEVMMPKAGPGFIYLFINDARIIAKLPQKVQSKRAKQEKLANFIVDVIGMKREHLMGIFRNGIMKHLGKSPEDVLAERLRSLGISGVGLLPLAAIPALIGLIEKIASLFKKKPEVKAEEAAPSDDDWSEISEPAVKDIATNVEQQPSNTTALDKILTVTQAVTDTAVQVKSALDAAKPAPAPATTGDGYVDQYGDYHSADGGTMPNVVITSKRTIDPNALYTPPTPPPTPEQPKDNTMLYVGLGVAALFILKN